MAQPLLPDGNLIWFKGKDNDMQVVVTNPSTGLPVDLTGGKVWLAAKYERGDPDSAAVVMLTSDTNDIVITDPVNGVALIQMPEDALAAVSPLVFLYWAVQARAIINSTPLVWEVASGVAVVRAGLVDATT